MIHNNEKVRSELITDAFKLECITIIWMVIEAILAIGSGLAAHSITLFAFGIDSVIELISASVLLWRLNVELKRGQQFSEAAEKRAGQIGAILLFALAIYVIAIAGETLWTRQGAEFSALGLVVAGLAMPIMYCLSKAKLRIAAVIDSRALRADAMESLTCGYLSFVVILGLVAEAAFHLWWVDSVASLVIVYFLVKEGKEAWRGEECCDHKLRGRGDSLRKSTPP